MAVLPVEQGNEHALGLGRCYGRDEVAVPGNQYRLPNEASGGELYHVDTEQDVYAFLLIYGSSQGVFAPAFEAPETYFESGKHSQRIKEPSRRCQSLLLTCRWRITLVREAVVVVRPEDLCF